MLLRSPALQAVEGVRHAFTGASLGTHQRLHLARSAGEGAEALEGRFAVLLRALEAPEASVALVRQVHGAALIEAEPGARAGRLLGDADAVWTMARGVYVAVRVADCVPILLAAPGAVAAVHAGWRGTAADIIGVAVRALCERTGCAPSDIVAAIGPHIGRCCYEVGPEVVEGIGARVPEAAFVEARRPRPHVDLAAANAWLLESAGVVRIDRFAACTRCDEGFFSHRRDGVEAGRQVGIIGALA